MKNTTLLNIIFLAVVVSFLGCKKGGGGGGGGGNPTPTPVSTPTGSATPAPTGTPDPNPSPLQVECPPPVSPFATPAKVSLPFGGNGHAETWDGRVFISTQNQPVPPHTVGWFIRVLRPQNIAKQSGMPVFDSDTFSGPYEWELDILPGSGMTWHNALGIAPTPGFPENPFRSDAAGNFSADGEYQTYAVSLITQYYILNGEQLVDQTLGRRKARIVIKNPHGADATVQTAFFEEPYQNFKTVSGKLVHGMEPTVTFDGSLVIYQGHPDNDNKIDNIMYIWNANGAAIDGWSEPKNITAMNLQEKNTAIGGVKFAEKYPIAAQPLKDNDGKVYAGTETYPGAYPWITLDGTELFHTATVAGVPDVDRARRGGAAIIGRWTGYSRRHIDGPINPNRDGKTAPSLLRLVFSSPGAFPSMWQPYRDVENLPIPFTPHRPVLPLIGLNNSVYHEVSFDDYVDRSYTAVLHFNEHLTRRSDPDPLKTSDTSGNFNNGTLEKGAKFPQEYNNVDQNMGAVGQAIYLPDTGDVRVKNTTSLANYPNGITVSFFMKRVVDLAQDGDNRYRYLVSKAGSFDVLIEESGLFSVSVVSNGQSRRLQFQGDPAPVGQWTHVSFSYDPASGRLRFYQDGDFVGENVFGAGKLDASNADLVIGPAGILPSAPFVPAGQAVVMIDELYISSVIRTDSEIKIATHADLPPPNYAPGINPPLGLKKSEMRVTAGNAVTSRAVELGHMLFFDQRLSIDNSTSCSTCHDPGKGFSDGRRLSVGLGGKLLPRNSPSIVNRIFGSLQFWDGRAATLEAQALIPIPHPDEMGLPLADAVTRLKAIPGYVQRFDLAYGQPPSADLISRAIASFQRTVLSGNSKVDRYDAGDLGALNESELRGRHLFFGKAHCVGCHNGSNYSDESFHNTGFFCKVTDQGLKIVTGRTKDLGAFKTPSLRDVEHSAPYTHAGRVPTLEEMVDIYNMGGLTRTGRDPEIKALGLSGQEKADLVAFIKALSGTTVNVPQPSLP